MKTRRKLVIIGGGPGGLVVASVASQLGLQVTLIEKSDRLGGDCLHSGCVPSKTLIHAARVAALMRRGAEFGLDACEPRVDLGRVSDHVQSVIDRIQEHDDPERFRSYGCEVLFGAAEFVDAHRVRVNDDIIRGRRIVIATGSRPLVPPVEGLQESGFLTNETLFSLRELPARLVVLGGGPVGVEMAQAFARLGSEVSVVERLPQLLPQEDPEVAQALGDLLSAEGIRIHTGTAAERVTIEGAKRVLECSGDVRLEADQLLVAVGRQPAVEGLNLEAAGVEYDRRGIGVDSRMRTSQKHIFACGDVCGPYPFTHMAEYQAGVVISNAVFRFPKKADYRVVPWVTYTDPELARVGLTAAQAAEQGIEPVVLRFPFRDVDRALAEVEPHGFVKLVTHRKKILGATILGAHAGELIHEIALAMQTGATIGDISATIHAYPTLAQVHRRAVNTYYGGRLFSPGTRRLVRWINRLVP
ncbi:MAG: FAD-dependent oxidoreductase [Gammaproteobacteria bacterium]|jgi:pyruvate/2-oxoglutarate dehydrogenase complex dihydrolipoamide dehydrogenase (E3) component